jgi:hypothetical protein
LVINGRLDLAYFSDPTLPATIGTIRRLRIVSTPGISESRQKFLEFIESFPKLELLDLALSTGAGLPLEELRCPQLHTLCLRNLWVTEDTLLKTIGANSQIRTVRLNSITLSSGTWHSFFTQLHRVERRVNVLTGI